MKNWTIRSAGAGDAGGMANCIDAAYADYMKRIPDLPPLSEDCAAEIADNAVFVAEQDRSVVGVLVLKPRDDFMMLINVAVSPKMRGAGLGKALLQLSEEETVRHGFSEMRLNTHAEMNRTVSLYQRNGWLVTGQTGNKISMRKVLTV